MKVSARVLATIAVAVALTPIAVLKAQTLVPVSLSDTPLRSSAPEFEDGASGAAVPAVLPPRRSGISRVDLFLGYSRFGVGVNSTNGTVGNRVVGLNGGSASLAFHFNSFFALAADFGGYDDSQLQLTGTGTNQPFVVNSSGTAFTYMFGPRLTFAREHRVSAFAQVLAGGIHASPVTVAGCSGSACTPLPAQNSLAMSAGGGLDIRLSHRISLRAVQAEYMLTRFASIPSGTSSSQNDLRLSSGLVFRFGGATEMLPLQLQCSVQPQTGFPGDSFTATATPSNLNPKRAVVYSWTTNGGVVSGSDASAVIKTADMAPGTYSVAAKATQGPRATQQANCTASFTIQSFEPPAISCSASPATIVSGDSVTVTAVAASPQNRALTYSYLTSSGKVTGDSPIGTLTTAGVDPGPIKITCSVTDDLGRSASADTSVTVTAPPAVVAPQTRDLCSISFERDHRRPTRVDNEAKACLDDIALQLQHEPSGRLVIIGGYSPEEKPADAAARSTNERDYLTNDKGIDSQRIQLRVGASGTRTATNVFVPEGASYTATDSSPVDATGSR